MALMVSVVQLEHLAAQVQEELLVNKVFLDFKVNKVNMAWMVLLVQLEG